MLGARSTDTWDNWLIPAATPGTAPRRVLPREKGHKYDVEHRDGVLYLRTNKDAKNFRLVTAPLCRPVARRLEAAPRAPPRCPARGGGAVPRLRRGAGEAGGPQPSARPLVRGRPVARGRVSGARVQRLRRGHARVRLSAAALQLPEPGDTPERLRLRHGGRGLDPPQARGGAGWLRPATLRLREPVGHGTRRYYGADQHRVPEGLRARRQGAALALRLRLVRLRHAGELRQPAAEPARARDPVRDRARPRRQRDGRELARRRDADEEEEHLLRLHRLRRAPGPGEVDFTRQAADRGWQRRRPADGRRRQRASRPLPRGARGRALRRRGEHDDGREPAADGRRVPRVGQPQRAARVRLPALLQPLRQPGARGPTRRCSSPRATTTAR